MDRTAESKYQRTITVQPHEVSAFNSRWPCSELDPTRSYSFTFDALFDLIDTDVPEAHDGGAAAAMADDCRAYCFKDVVPVWADQQVGS